MHLGSQILPAPAPTPSRAQDLRPPLGSPMLGSAHQKKIRTSNIQHRTPNVEQKSGAAIPLQEGRGRVRRAVRQSSPKSQPSRPARVPIQGLQPWCAAFFSSVQCWMFGVQCSMFAFPEDRARGFSQSTRQPAPCCQPTHAIPTPPLARF